MKRTALIKKIRTAASRAGVEVALTEGGNHSVLRCGTARTVIPRHREINELTTEAICKQLESTLGKRWWR